MYISLSSGECINSSVAGKRRIAEWSALHTESVDVGGGWGGSAGALLAVCAVVAAVCLAAVLVLQVSWYLILCIR